MDVYIKCIWKSHVSFLQEIQERILILELYAKDRQFASFVRQHQAWVSFFFYEIWGSAESLLKEGSVILVRDDSYIFICQTQPGSGAVYEKHSFLHLHAAK